jgi:hypothetical protein
MQKAIWITFGLLLCLFIGSYGQDNIQDTSYGKYVFFVNKEAYSSTPDSNGTMHVTIIVPPSAKSGDTLLNAFVWEGVPKIFLQAHQDVVTTKNDIDALTKILEDLKTTIDTAGQDQ